jgi:hypothetical protein
MFLRYIDLSVEKYLNGNETNSIFKYIIYFSIFFYFV